MLHVSAVSSGTATPLTRVDLNEQVYATLKEQLATRQLTPGEKLSLHELALSFGVSRSPVQHALTRLVSEGLVDVRPHRGHFVRPLTAELLVEAHEVREALELYAAARTVGRLGDEELAELRRLMERTLTMVDGQRLADQPGYIATNQAFHDYQVGLARNRLLLERYRSLSVNQMMQRILAGAPATDSELAAEHRELVEAFEAGRLPRVARAIRIHVETGKRLALEAIEQAGGVL